MVEKKLIYCGYSVGDTSVGIWPGEFTLETGMTFENEKEYKEFIENKMCCKTHLFNLFQKEYNKAFKGKKGPITVDEWTKFVLHFLMNDMHDNGRMFVFRPEEEQWAEPECTNCQGENRETGFVENWDGKCPDCGRQIMEEENERSKTYD